MFTDKDAIIIDGVSMGQYLLAVKYEYPKLWAEDSGRNLAGVQSGTLIGIFPKLVLQFRALTKAEFEIIAPILDKANQSVTYYDPIKKQKITMTTYTGDYSFTNNTIISNGRKISGFECSFIAVRARSWLNENSYK